MVHVKVGKPVEFQLITLFIDDHFLVENHFIYGKHWTVLGWIFSLEEAPKGFMFQLCPVIEKS